MLENISSISYEKIMWLGVVFSILVFIIMTFIFRHHWSYYGIDRKTKVFVSTMYIFGSFLLIVLLSLLAIFY